MKLQVRNQLLRAILSGAAATLLLPAQSGAQEGRLEEIVVTATKRSVSTQEIPMSLEVVTGDDLKAYRINGFDDLSANIANFVVAEGITQNNVVMRGLGSLGDRGFEMPVSLFVDDVYSPRSRQYRLPFMDAERVEVLRGPQAVLFGLNSTAGAVNIVSRSNMPDDPFSSEVTLGYESEFSGWFAGFTVGGGMTDTLGVRLAYEHFDTGDGFYSNAGTGASENAKTQDALRLSLMWLPTDDLTVSGKFSWAEYDIEDGSFGEIANGIGSALEPTDGVANWVTSADTYLADRQELHPPGGTSDFASATVKVDYEMESHTLTGIASYSDFYFVLSTDIDMTVGGFIPGAVFPIGVWAAAATDYEQTSFELRLASDTGQTLEYILGLYYQDGDYYEPTDNGSEALLLNSIGPAFDAFFNTRTGGAVQSDTTLWSAYAALTWNISDVFRLTGGLRYTDEQKDGVRTGFCFGDTGGGNFIQLPHGFGALNCPTIDFAEDSLDFGEAMPEIAAQWDVSDNVMLYAKAGRTYKSGGFATANSATIDTFSYDPEEATGIEAGMRSRLADDRVELNVSIFSTDYKDLQVNSFQTDNLGNTLASVKNAGEATSEGLEADLRWAANDWLQFGASIAFLNGEYDKYEEGPCSRTEGAATGGTICDFSGRQMPFAADSSGSVSAAIDTPLGSSMRFLAGVVVSYSDGYFTDTTLEPDLMQDSWTKVAARVGIADADNRWDLVLSGLNLTDEAILTGANILFGYDIVYLGAPRTVTLQGSMRFGGR